MRLLTACVDRSTAGRASGVWFNMTDPAPVPIVRRSRYEPQGPSEVFIVPLLRRVIEDGLQRYAAPSPARARALDVGCGESPFREPLEALGYRYIGFDVQQNTAHAVHTLGAIDAPLPPA